MSSTRSPSTRAVQRFALRTGQTPLRAVWAVLYRAWARVFIVSLTWRERGASGYYRPAGIDFIPGLSDVDLIIVLGEGREAPGVAALRMRRRARRLRARRLHRRFPIIDDPLVYEADELRDVLGSCALTYGLAGRGGGDSRQGAYVGDSANADVVRMLTRPGLYSSLDGWDRLTGPERRPDEPARDSQQQRIAAWLELVFWWRVLPRAFVEPAGPRPADVCVKCIAEAVRIWIWLARGERKAGRVEALDRGLALLPEEEDGLRRTLELRRSLPRDPDPAQVLEETVPLLVRLSSRVAELIDTEAQAAGFTDVRLIGGHPRELMLAGGAWRPNTLLAGGRSPEILPLADWRGLACPIAPDDAFAALTADATDPFSYIAAAALNKGPYPTLVADRLLIRPGTEFVRTRLRALECPTTDPVSFALLGRRRAASFPNLRGWSAPDVATRAVAEHRAWLYPEASYAADVPRGHALGMLLSAARAGLFLESIRGGKPELPLTLTEAVRILAGRSNTAQTAAEEALGHYRAFVHSGAHPSPTTLTAMRNLVLELPAYASR
jgi:hypothetical protein